MPHPEFTSAMKRLLAFCLVSWASSLPLRSAEVVVPLWDSPVSAPSHPETVENKNETGRLDRWISYVSEPSLTFYPVESKNGPVPAVLVIPGGGFRYVCIDKEGTEVARWLNSIGFAAAVLKYRTLEPNAERTPQSIEPIFADGFRAMRVLRQHAAEWHVGKIGVMSFSAGAVMALKLTMADAPVEKEPTLAAIGYRPDFVVIAYGGLPPKMGAALKPLPPFFIVHAADDSKAPVAVTGKIAKYVEDNGGSIEMHIFARGEHGFGIQPMSGPVSAWPGLCAAWLHNLD